MWVWGFAGHVLGFGRCSSGYLDDVQNRYTSPVSAAQAPQMTPQSMAAARCCGSCQAGLQPKESQDGASGLRFMTVPEGVGLRVQAHSHSSEIQRIGGSMVQCSWVESPAHAGGQRVSHEAVSACVHVRFRIHLQFRIPLAPDN